MSNLSKFRQLSNKDKIVVGIAVLLDGHDAPMFLSNTGQSNFLSEAASDLVTLPPDIRLSFLGTSIRRSIAKLEVPASNTGNP